jgi:hypothetical protein
MNRIKTIFLISLIGHTLLLGSSEISWALMKTRAGHTYCDCMCTNFRGSADLTWEKVASCGLNGKACSFNNKSDNGILESGTLSRCLECIGDSSGGYADCKNATAAGMPGSITPPQEQGSIQPPGSPSTSPGVVTQPGMRARITPRGIEPEQPAEPSPGMPGPSEQPSGK